MAVAAHLDNIAALRVCGTYNTAVPSSGTFIEDVHVETVKMHGVAEAWVSISDIVTELDELTG